VICDKSK